MILYKHKQHFHLIVKKKDNVRPTPFSSKILQFSKKVFVLGILKFILTLEVFLKFYFFW